MQSVSLRVKDPEGPERSDLFLKYSYQLYYYIIFSCLRFWITAKTHSGSDVYRAASPVAGGCGQTRKEVGAGAVQAVEAIIWLFQAL